MTDAGGTNTLIQLENEGPYMRYLLRNDSVDNGQTIPFDSPSNSPVQAGDRVIIESVHNMTQETSSAGTVTSAEYSESNKHFTVTDAAASSSDLMVVFTYIPQGDPALGS